jgi:Zn-finger nucleic acid-binding protein
MRCPHCGIASLEERERDGVMIHVCCGCRGIWLDRGELQKLFARFVREREVFQQLSTSRNVARLDAEGQSPLASWFETIRDIVH